MKKVLLALMLLGSMSFGMSLSQLNSASKEDLMQINGIGAKKAAAILKARKSGKFKSYEDLASRVDGIGPQTAANIKNDVKAGDKVKKVAKKAKKADKKVKDAKKSAKKVTDKKPSMKKPSKANLKKKAKTSAKKKVDGAKSKAKKKATQKATKALLKK